MTERKADVKVDKKPIVPPASEDPREPPQVRDPLHKGPKVRMARFVQPLARVRGEGPVMKVRKV